MSKSEQPPFEELRPGRFFQMGRELFRVSNPYPNHLTAQVLYPKPSRTSVRTIQKDEYDKRGSAPTEGMLRRYEQAWGFAKEGK